MKGCRRKVMMVGVLLLCGGAIVNVAVAWGIAVAPKSDGVGYERRMRDSHPQTFVWVNACEVLIVQYSGVMSINWLGNAPMTVSEEVYRRLLPRGSAFSGNDPALAFNTDNLMVDVSERTIGWPALSMACRETILYESADKIHVNSTMLKLPDHWSVGRGRNKTRIELPTMPIWPGFAINTIFYAAILWVVFFAPGMVKRTLRRRRGLCPACAYPIGTSEVCTECGKPINRSESSQCNA